MSDKGIQLYYRLRPNHTVEPCTLEQWSAMLKDAAARTVGRTELSAVVVSTVFLGMDHGWGQGPPILFETMVFQRGPNGSVGTDLACERYATWAEAEAGHAVMVARYTRSRAVTL